MKYIAFAEGGVDHGRFQLSLDLGDRRAQLHSCLLGTASSTTCPADKASSVCVS